MSRDSGQGLEKTGIPSSGQPPHQTLPSLTSVKLLLAAPSHANTEFLLEPIRWVRILLRNAIRKTTFVLFDDEWLLNKLRVRVRIDYPPIATMPLGDIHTAFVPHRCMDYIHDHPESKLAVVRGVASGIKYLHDNGIAHGDVKTDNIMIHNDGRAQIVNFRSSELESLIDLPITHQAQKNTRFCSPESLMLSLTENDVKPTFKADVFGFAMTMLQVRIVPVPEIFQTPAL
ncbi:hypothetical protein EST38_g3956 [Candolleomyces aberdarensis]|uniref:Protein kinase domain-containing protein n=1 Tax=Candolleomyces aberdarensis TaxID=2316362 RepID=A0A4Q2DRN4_9AGAR|nr:hypothetical protein EST38_g3956 [Candolleomyces aberdarensis]